MSVIPIEVVRGEVNIADRKMTPLSSTEVARVLEKVGAVDLQRVSIKDLAGQAAIVLEQTDGMKRLYDAKTSVLLTPINEIMATQIAVYDYQHSSAKTHVPVAVLSAYLLTEEPGDFRRKLPVWQITLDDPDGTRIYVSPDTGDVLARRNDYWRLYDFFWMLHIMDYETRDDFNNPLIIVASITASLFVISGVILLYFRFGPQVQRMRARKTN